MSRDSALRLVKRYFPPSEPLDRQALGGLSLYAFGRDLYALDSPEGRVIACDPSVCGEEFRALNASLARKAFRALEEKALYDVGPGSGTRLLFQHVLRASLGYGLREAAMDAGHEFVEVWSRPLYAHASYRQHTVSDLVMAYDQPSQLPGGKYVVLKPDTEATASTSLFTLQNLLEKCDRSGCRIEKVIFYGFIAEPAVRKLRDYLGGKNIASVFFAIEDVTPLAANGYDMPLYGIDEAQFSSSGEKHRLFGLTPPDVLEGEFDCYYPGMDQPGDWSERQPSLFDGVDWKKVDLSVHLRRSLDMLRRMREINAGEPWYADHHEEVYRKLEDKLEKKISANSRRLLCMAPGSWGE